MTIRVRFRREGKVYDIEPWKAALPHTGDRVALHAADLVGARITLFLPGGGVVRKVVRR